MPLFYFDFGEDYGGLDPDIAVLSSKIWKQPTSTPTTQRSTCGPKLGTKAMT
jgi:hypothetical protein